MGACSRPRRVLVAANPGRFTVPELSIIIAAMGNYPLLESGLVSVLANRPRSAELIVVLNSPYADPYQLSDEIAFVQASAKSGLADCLNLGIQRSRGAFIHTLGCGVEVSDGWTQAALRHFDNARVASVAPIALAAEDPRQVVAAGVGYSQGGKCYLRTRLPSSEGAASCPVLGAASLAGFYRKAAICTRSGTFSPVVGDQCTDVDLALRLRSAGWLAVCEPRSRVFAPPQRKSPSGFLEACRAERLFLRNAGVIGWQRSLLAHPLTVAAEFFRGLPRTAALTQVAGRCAAWLELRHFRGAGPHLARPPIQAAPAEKSERRLDRLHASPARAEKGAPQTSQRLRAS